MPELTLYVGKTCPFCRRVLDYLNQHPMPIQIKDVWSDEKAYQELLTLAGKSQVPCLKMDSTIVHESLDIIEVLKHIQT